MADLQELEAKIGYCFRDRDLLVRALTHRSFSTETRPSRFQPDNEQLEFFGDSILGFLVSEALLAGFPALPEGKLSHAKSFLVSSKWLHKIASELGVGEFLQLGRGEERGGGRVKASLLANAMEALIAALYLDGGLEPARAFVLKFVYTADLPASVVVEHANYKGQLWERASSGKLPRPEYRTVQTSGPAHAPSFVVEARLGELYKGVGAGPSKKAAEQEAARSLLSSMAEAAQISAD